MYLAVAEEEGGQVKSAKEEAKLSLDDKQVAILFVSKVQCQSLARRIIQGGEEKVVENSALFISWRAEVAPLLLLMDSTSQPASRKHPRTIQSLHDATREASWLRHESSVVRHSTTSTSNSSLFVGRSWFNYTTKQGKLDHIHMFYMTLEASFVEVKI